MTRDNRPNILWLCTDQQRYDTIGVLGNSYVSTPTLNRLVAEGVAFTSAYCQSPICTPSRASFLTGMYPSAVRVNRNGNPKFPDHPPLISKILADSGYDCGLIGKLHLTSAFSGVEPRTNDGYRYWQYSHAPRDDWSSGHDYSDWVRSKGFVLGELNQDMQGVPPELHQTSWCAEKTIEFIQQDRAGPWLASVNFYDPHPPFNPPQAYRDMFQREQMPGPLFRESDLAHQKRLEKIDFQSRAAHPNRLDINNPVIPQAVGHEVGDTVGDRDAKTLQAAYYAMIRLIDDEVGRILEALEATGQCENTLIVFNSDHGESLGDHGLILKGCRFYEGLVRVPLIFSWPGHIEAGRRSSALVELLDIAPTLLELAGLPIPDHMQGHSLASMLRGEASSQRHRDYVRSEYFDALDMPDGTFATMYFDGRYKLTVYHGHNLGELYDLQEDPGEFDDLWHETASQELKLNLIGRSFSATIHSMDSGLPRVAPI